NNWQYTNLTCWIGAACGSIGGALSVPLGQRDFRISKLTDRLGIKKIPFTNKSFKDLDTRVDFTEAEARITTSISMFSFFAYALLTEFLLCLQPQSGDPAYYEKYILPWAGFLFVAGTIVSIWYTAITTEDNKKIFTALHSEENNLHDFLQTQNANENHYGAMDP